MNEMKMMRDKVNSLRVLVIDDEDKVLESSIQFMHKFFDHVDGAEDGETALKMFGQNGGYDVVFSDIRMPQMSGWELIQALRDVDKELFIATVTGSPELATEKLIGTCDSFLKKPVSIDDMLQLMKAIISKRGL